MKETWVICWLDGHGNEGGEWFEFQGTLDEAIALTKSDRRYQNYGHHGARIYPAILKYEIKMGPVEWRA